MGTSYRIGIIVLLPASALFGCAEALELDGPLDKEALQGCVEAEATDMTDAGVVVIKLEYLPRCVVVAVGSEIDFPTSTAHPLKGGFIDAEGAEQAIPIEEATTSGDMLLVPARAGRAIPFYCGEHFRTDENARGIVFIK